ncbi:kinase-like domain-containing protein [Phyllosticta citribraziliensis]
MLKGSQFIWQQVDAIRPTSENDAPRLVFEHLGSQLSEVYIDRKLTRQEIKSIMKSTLLGLQHIEQKGFIFTDMTPANIYLQNDGASSLRPAELTTKFGPIDQLDKPFTWRESDEVDMNPFVAPEILFGKAFSYPTHIWAWGVILCHLLESRAAWISNRLESLHMGGIFQDYGRRWDGRWACDEYWWLCEMVDDFNIDSCEYYDDCDMPYIEIFKPCKHDWKERLRIKGLREDDVCFLDWLLDPNPETRPTPEQVLQTGYLEWNEEDTEDEP